MGGSAYVIAKYDEEQCVVFGYANVAVSKSTAAGAGGSNFADLQDDIIPPDELERAAYDHVLEFREADEMHQGPVQGRLVESMVFTPDKLLKFATDPTTGIVNPADLATLQRLFPSRWWVGYKFDRPVFEKVKSGQYSMFSIAGEAEKSEVTA